MQFKEREIEETELRESEVEPTVISEPEPLKEPELKLDSAPELESDLPAPALTKSTEKAVGAKPSPSELRVSESKEEDTETSNYLKKYRPHAWLAALLPIFVAFSLISSNVLFLLRHLGASGLQPPAIDVCLLPIFVIASFVFTLYASYARRKLVRHLFLPRVVDTKSSVKERLESYKGLNMNCGGGSALLMFLRATAPSRSGPPGLIMWVLTQCIIALLTALICPILIGPLAFAITSVPLTSPINWVSCCLGFVLSAATALFAHKEVRDTDKLIKVFEYARRDPHLCEFVKRPIARRVVREEVVIPFDAFVGVERWIKRRFDQKSWKKTAFMGALICIFIAFDGFHLIETGLVYSTMSIMSLTNPDVGGVGPRLEQHHVTINYLRAILATLAFGGLGAALAVMIAPTQLIFSRSGIAYNFGRRPIGNGSDSVPWSKIQQMRLVSRKGKNLLSDKTLEFVGNGRTLMKFQLGCVNSVSARETILECVERFAPSIKRDAEIIQALQRPPEQSYTDLWLQALAAPPKRDRLKPLIEHASLQDGRYSIIKTLGLGGQGTAYLAKDKQTDQVVALKEFILPIYVDIGVRKAALQRFENEARILKNLESPQIVRLNDFFVEDHRGYLALEYIEGEDLKAKVERSGKLPEPDVIELAIQMCRILAYLHGRTPEVIHRDFTPDNLILQKNGQLKLIDFNVAQQTDSTVTGTIVGKQCYLPPEQFQGEPVIQSDIYSMGATIFFLVTGQEPEPISQSKPSQIDPTISAGLDRLVRTATSIDPAARQKNAQECLEELLSMPDEGGHPV